MCGNEAISDSSDNGKKNIKRICFGAVKSIVVRLTMIDVPLKHVWKIKKSLCF